ncbi:MAG: nucleotidyltransferase domain-containing protein [Thermoplasmata archaeon]
MLRKALGPSLRVILQALLVEAKTLSELGSVTAKSKPTLLKHLRFLDESGLVTKTVQVTKTGRETSYSINPYTLFLHIDPRKKAFITFETPDDIELPLLLAEQVPQKEFRSDVKIYLLGVADECRDWHPQPTVIVFGSVARGEATWKSDIDVLFVLRDKMSDKAGRALTYLIAEDVLRGRLAEATSEAEHLMRPHFTGIEEFIKEDKGIMREAKSEGILIFGDLNAGWDIWQQLERYRSITI